MNLQMFETSAYHKELQIAIKSALKAGEILKNNFMAEHNFKKKNGNELVTEMDEQSENLIKNIIYSNFPNDLFFGEETGGEKNSMKRRWIVDPLDGTVNYAHRLPIFCVSIAFEEDKELKAGVIYNPMNNELFYALKNYGAYKNGEKISVSACKNITDSFLVTGFPYDINKRINCATDIFKNVLSQIRGIRRLGSAAMDLCYVANGIFDGFWEIGLKQWDVAAGILLIREAGGKVTNFKGENYTLGGFEILATNKIIHEELQKIINPTY